MFVLYVCWLHMSPSNAEFAKNHTENHKKKKENLWNGIFMNGVCCSAFFLYILFRDMWVGTYGLVWLNVCDMFVLPATHSAESSANV